jgi:16S rRNA C1402 N4-methylase RsmH
MRLTELAHHILTEHLQDGDRAIDATAGNGHDTIFLARQVGSEGRIITIDIQDAAVEATRTRLEQAKLLTRVTLRTGNHADIMEELALKHAAEFAAIIFNLGYLPGSDQGVQTQPTTTRRALHAALELLQPSGRLCVTAYRAHTGGLEEAATVEAWMHQQKAEGHSIEVHVPPSDNSPPILWVLRKTRCYRFEKGISRC